jgi:hypothetical protein
MEGTREVHGRWCWVLTRRARAANRFDVMKTISTCAPSMSLINPHTLVVSKERTLMTIHRRSQPTGLTDTPQSSPSSVTLASAEALCGWVVWAGTWVWTTTTTSG